LIRKIIKIGSRLVLAFSFICLVRLSLQINFLEILIFYPIMAYAIHAAIEIYEQRSKNIILTKLEDGDTLNNN
jgi:hypothetical protein